MDGFRAETGLMLLGQESIRDVILFPQLEPKA
jgi:lysyl-tRNA synthetase class II